MWDSHQSSLWYLDPLGQAAPVHTDLSRSSIVTISPPFMPMHIWALLAVTCLPHTLRNGVPHAEQRPLPDAESQFQLCKVVKTWCLLLLSFLFRRKAAVWRHKFRITHILSNWARGYMGGWLEHGMLETKKNIILHFSSEAFGLARVCVPYRFPPVEGFWLRDSRSFVLIHFFSIL